MNYLDLCKKTQVLSGLQGQIESVTGLTGELYKMVQYVDMAYIQIQTMRKDWKFRQGEFDAALTTTDSTIDGTLAAEWISLVYDNRYLRKYDYDAWLVLDENANSPLNWTVVPETNQIIVNDLQEDATVLVRYIKQLDEFSTSVSVPILPLQYHMIIAYMAARDFTMYLGDRGMEDKNALLADIMMGQLMRSQVMKVRIQPKRFITRKNHF